MCFLPSYASTPPFAYASWHISAFDMSSIFARSQTTCMALVRLTIDTSEMSVYKPPAVWHGCLLAILLQICIMHSACLAHKAAVSLKK